jgi:CubicO group peptidase (beta-lactamase class C family)
VASQIKVFVATAVLQLVARGRVGLDDPVGRYLPRRLLAEMLTPVDTGAPAPATGWASVLRHDPGRGHGRRTGHPDTATMIRFR